MEDKTITLDDIRKIEERAIMLDGDPKGSIVLDGDPKGSIVLDGDPKGERILGSNGKTVLPQPYTTVFTYEHASSGTKITVQIKPEVTTAALATGTGSGRVLDGDPKGSIVLDGDPKGSIVLDGDPKGSIVLDGEVLESKPLVKKK